MIFHIPSPIATNPNSGSQIRPIQMIKAFRKLGFVVDIVAGYAKERKKSIIKIKQNIKLGVKYNFVYSENSTMPTLLSEKHHLPIFPFVDFNFLHFCKKQGLKIGLFYRDIYWVFDEYYNIPKAKKLFSLFFYKYDLKKYKKLIDVLFLPSTEMYDYFPIKYKNKIITSLYPAMNNIHETLNPKSDILKILYVGGIGKLYEFKELLKSVQYSTNIKLTICTRKEEWQANKLEYSKYLSDNITIVHKNGKELEQEYFNTDITSIFVEPIEYRKFAMPVKLFEYMSYQKPIIASQGTAVGNFVEKNNIGWTIPYNSEALTKLLRDINNNRELISEKENNILKKYNDNTWSARVKKVEKLLES